MPGDVYTDPDNSVVRTVELDNTLMVVIRPIGRMLDGIWVDNSIEGDGAALGSLLRRVDAAVTTFAGPAHGAGLDLDREFRSTGNADPTFPYGSTPGHGPLLSYRGPEDTHLTPNFYSVLSWNPPSWMYGWFCTLEIIDGTPLLYVWAGQIAG
jgi:hypothetical protein